jgi:Replication-relaxation
MPIDKGSTSAGVRRGQALRGHLVRRLPTRTELSARTTIALTERDRLVLAAVHSHGFLTTERIELAFFPAVQGTRASPSSQAYDRLRQLWLWEYLERVELPVARVLGGRRPFLYALGRQGASVVQACLPDDRPAVRPRRLDRLDRMFVEHDLRAAALWANLRAWQRTQAARSVRSIVRTAERSLRARRLRVRDPDRPHRWLPVLPDAAFEVRYADGGIQHVLVEIDMGTLSLERFRRKLRAFEACVEDGVFARHFQRPDFEVAILVPSRPRLVHLWRATRHEVSHDGAGAYLFATFDVLQPSRFPRAEWVTAANGLRSLTGSRTRLQSA